MRIVSSVIVIGLLGSAVAGQAPARPPVIDVHVHSTNTSPQQAIERMKLLNIRFLVVSTLVSDLPQWAGAHRSPVVRASTAPPSFPRSRGSRAN